jgi:SAM-dependent methyltransferase
MKPSRDAFGHQLLDFLDGEPALGAIERDDGYLDAAHSPEAYFAPYGSWPRSNQQALALARGRVLDIGCGAGRHGLHLQRKGRIVTGIDSSRLAVAVCKRRGLERARVLPITRLPAGLGPFDTVLLMGNNFGLFGTPRRARWLLRRFHRLTAADSLIIAETLDPYTTDDSFHLSYQRRNRRRRRPAGQIRMRVRYLVHATPWYDYLFVSRREMRAVLAGTGWRLRRTFRGPSGTYVAVIEKDAPRGRGHG